MTLSKKIAKDILIYGKDEEVIEDLGFITTVLRDNESDAVMVRYYQMVLAYLTRYHLAVKKLNKDDSDV